MEPVLDKKGSANLYGVDKTVKNVQTVNEPSAERNFENQAKTSLAELRNNYAKQLRAQYDYAAEKMKAEKDSALRENWVKQQQEEAGLAEKLAAEGINGGATETTLSGIRARYQDDRNDIRRDFSEDLGDLFVEQNKKLLEGARSYDEKWLDYLLSIAENEDEYLRENFLIYN